MNIKETIEAWLRKAAEMRAGERISIPVSDKTEGLKLRNQFLMAREMLSEYDTDVKSVSVYITFINETFSLELVKKAVNMTTAIMTKHDGTKEIIRLTEDRTRMIELMAKDGLNEAEIREQLEEISPDEERLLGVLFG